MKLILIRHTAAIINDKNRYLTSSGRLFFRKTARTISKAGAKPDLIITSPLLRAVQTADILAEALSYAGPLIVRNELRAGFDIQGLRKVLAEYQGMEELVLVGQEPDLSVIAASLLAMPEKFNFEKGTAICLKINPGDPRAAAVFKWLAAGSKLITSRKVLAPLRRPEK